MQCYRMKGEIMNHKHSKNVITRLSKIEGHVKAIKKMVEEGRSCVEILLQFSAVESALKKAGKIIVSDISYFFLSFTSLAYRRFP